MSFTHPKCAACMKEWIEPWCDRSCKDKERSLVEMELYDSDLGCAERQERQHIYEMEQDSFDYHTGGKPT